MRKFLSNCLDWSRIGFELCGVYACKETALNGILENKADIIITDIKLPDSDGLTLIDEVRNIYPQIQFIVVSAYSDFENVKKAFKIGAVDYILKTEFDAAHLEEMLIKSAQKIEINRKKETGDFKTFLEKENSLKKLFWSNSFSLVDDDKKRWRIGGKKDIRSVGIIKLLNYKNIEENWNYEKELIKYGIYNITEEIVGDDSEYEFFFYSYDEIVFIFGNNAEHKFEKLSEIVRVLNRELEFIISAGIVDIDEKKSLAEEYTACQSIAEYTFVIGRNQVIRDSDIHGKERFDVAYYTELVEKAVNELDFKKVSGILDGFSEYRCRPEYTDELKDFFYSCLVVINRYSKKLNHEFISQVDIHDYVAYSDVSSLIECMKKEITYFDETGFGKMDEIENYILKNYDKEITLKSIADRFCFEYSYFSKKFLKKTGKTFKQYLTDIRLEKAYNLIVNTNSSMMEISEKVGYKNYNNFSRSFIQKYGKKPVEIRKEV